MKGPLGPWPITTPIVDWSTGRRVHMSVGPIGQFKTEKGKDITVIGPIVHRWPTKAWLAREAGLVRLRPGKIGTA